VAQGASTLREFEEQAKRIHCQHGECRLLVLRLQSWLASSAVHAKSLREDVSLAILSAAVNVPIPRPRGIATSIEVANVSTGAVRLRVKKPKQIIPIPTGRIQRAWVVSCSQPSIYDVSIL
jgi:hypothetical protein